MSGWGWRRTFVFIMINELKTNTMIFLLLFSLSIIPYFDSDGRTLRLLLLSGRLNKRTRSTLRILLVGTKIAMGWITCTSVCREQADIFILWWTMMAIFLFTYMYLNLICKFLLLFFFFFPLCNCSGRWIDFGTLSMLVKHRGNRDEHRITTTDWSMYLAIVMGEKNSDCREWKFMSPMKSWFEVFVL